MAFKTRPLRVPTSRVDLLKAIFQMCDALKHPNQFYNFEKAKLTTKLTVEQFEDKQTEFIETYLKRPFIDFLKCTQKILQLNKKPTLVKKSMETKETHAQNLSKTCQCFFTILNTYANQLKDPTASSSPPYQEFQEQIQTCRLSLNQEQIERANQFFTRLEQLPKQNPAIDDLLKSINYSFYYSFYLITQMVDYLLLLWEQYFLSRNQLRTRSKPINEDLANAYQKAMENMNLMLTKLSVKEAVPLLYATNPSTQFCFEFEKEYNAVIDTFVGDQKLFYEWWSPFEFIAQRVP